jgi:competence protein ComEA
VAGRLSRTGWLAVVGLALLAVGVPLRLLWPSSRPALDCAPEDVRWTDAGVAVCAPGTPRGIVPTGAALTVGVKLDLNVASEQELGLVPGIGPGLARALVEGRTRRGPFKTWDDVDQVTGIGPSKLEALKASAEIR